MIKNVLQLLENSADLYPEKRAFSDQKGFVTYQDAVSQAKAVGTYLTEFGRQNSAVAIMLDKSKEAIVSFMGTIYSGNFYVPIDENMPEDRVKKIFGVVRPFMVITDIKNREKAESVAGGVPVVLYGDMAATKVEEEKLREIRTRSIDADPVYALFTSGSTGVPKGVVCCHRSVVDYSDWLVETFEFDSRTVFGNQTPFYFSMSVLDIYATIRSGGELHILPRKYFTFPMKLLAYMNEKRINAIYWVPTMLCLVANLRALERNEMPFLKKILFAGESMPVKQLNIWRKYVPNALYANLFGPTEITDIGVYYIVDREFTDDESLPIGRACDNVGVLILNGEDKEAAAGEIGELCIRGSFLALGYYNDKTKTNSSFIQNPLNTHYPDLIYRTGDMVSVNDRGELLYHGRRDFQIKRQGNRIELGEIENAAGGVDGVETCACIYEEQKQKIILFYQGQRVSQEDLQNEVEKKVSSYMFPDTYIKLPQFPVNANGKIDRKGLREEYLSGEIRELGKV